jgi:hypothetical protein
MTPCEDETCKFYQRDRDPGAAHEPSPVEDDE